MIHLRTFSPATLYLNLILCAILISCKSPQDPEFREITSFRFEKSELSGFDLHVKALVYNPNKYKVSLLNYDLDIFLNEAYLGRAKSDRKQSLGNRETAELNFVVHTETKNLLFNGLGMLGLFFGKEKDARVRIRGKTRVKALGVRKRLDIDYSSDVNFNP